MQVKKTKKFQSQKGQGLIELGFSMMVLLLLLAAVIELGMLLFQYIAMRDAAEEGAVYTSIYPGACAQIVDRVKKDLYNADPAQVQVVVEINGVACASATASDACALKEAKVTVNQPDYEITTPFLGTFLGRQSLNLSISETSTIVRPPCP